MSTFRKFNKTKLIATIGPASCDHDMLESLILSGVDVCRINFSHGTHADHEKVIKNIRSISKKHELPIAIMADLQGPKIRLGEIENNKITIHSGNEIILTSTEVLGTAERLHVTYPELTQDIDCNHRILLDDGKIELQCMERIDQDELRCKIIYGGIVSSRKGVNLPDTNISQPSLTKKDFADLIFALSCDVEWVALSFVREASDIVHLKQIIKEKKKHTKVIAKIEKPEALECIQDIVQASDAIMVARGDLGVELPVERLPFIQKDLVSLCISQSKPVIIATHIMESMIEHPTPTRAEVNDVVNAMIDGADALMLSAETASGKYPLKTVEMIIKIISEVEDRNMIYNRNLSPNPNSVTFLSDAICYNACKIATDVGAHAIIGMTRSGYTAFMTSSYRPKAHIFIFTDKPSVLNTMNLLFGVRAYYYDKFVGTDETIFDLHEILRIKGLVTKGDILINLASMPIKDEGRTNMLKITRIQ